MPKISYIPKENNGVDTSEVTVEQIEQKLSEINALLRGMVDVDNMLEYENSSDTVPVTPSNVMDMPLETRPVNHCMKFFGRLVQDESIFNALPLDLKENMESSPKLFSLNNLGDAEIVITVVNTDQEEAEWRRDFVFSKSITVEIPTSFVPLTWKDVYVLTQDLLPELISEEEDFYKIMGVRPQDLASELIYDIPFAPLVSISPPVFVGKENRFFCDASIEIPKNKEGDWLLRVVPSLLCRVIP
jgi:hypothetical protein